METDWEMLEINRMQLYVLHNYNFFLTFFFLDFHIKTALILFQPLSPSNHAGKRAASNNDINVMTLMSFLTTMKLAKQHAMRQVDDHNILIS